MNFVLGIIIIGIKSLRFRSFMVYFINFLYCRIDLFVIDICSLRVDNFFNFGLFRRFLYFFLDKVVIIELLFNNVFIFLLFKII